MNGDAFIRHSIDHAINDPRQSEHDAGVISIHAAIDRIRSVYNEFCDPDPCDMSIQPFPVYEAVLRSIIIDQQKVKGKDNSATRIVSR